MVTNMTLTLSNVLRSADTVIITEPSNKATTTMTTTLFVALYAIPERTAVRTVVAPIARLTLFVANMKHAPVETVATINACWTMTFMLWADVNRPPVAIEKTHTSTRRNTTGSNLEKSLSSVNRRNEALAFEHHSEHFIPSPLNHIVYKPMFREAFRSEGLMGYPTVLHDNNSIAKTNEFR